MGGVPQTAGGRREIVTSSNCLRKGLETGLGSVPGSLSSGDSQSKYFARGFAQSRCTNFSIVKYLRKVSPTHSHSSSSLNGSLR